jgi:hypothetical protein
LAKPKARSPVGQTGMFGLKFAAGQIALYQHFVNSGKIPQPTIPVGFQAQKTIFVFTKNTQLGNTGCLYEIFSTQTNKTMSRFYRTLNYNSPK